MTPLRPPAAAPCASCPYRRDVPSGVWAESEYNKLPAYDGTIAEQAMASAIGVFVCHQQDGRACAGWVGCHDMHENLALRLGVGHGQVDESDIDAFLDYETAVPLFGSGAEAAEHGKRDIDTPGPEASKITRRLARKLDL